MQRRRRGKTCLILISSVSITEQLAASSSSEHLGLFSIIEELGSPPFVSSRCPRCPKNSLFNNCSSSSHTFHTLSSAPSSPPQRGHMLQPSAHLKAAIASLSPLLLPATTSQDPCLSGVPACSILLQRLRVNSPGFKDPYCLQITIKLNYLKICWLYDQTYMMIAWRSICFC